MGNAKFLHKREKTLKQFGHSPTLSGRIDVKDRHSSQRLCSTINACKHIFSHKASILI